MTGNAKMTVEGNTFNVRYNIPMHRGGTFNKSRPKWGISNQPTLKNALSSATSGERDNLVFDLYHPNGNQPGGHVMFITVGRSNSGKAMRRMNKRFPSRNFIPLKQ